MPVKVEKRGDKFRVVEASSGRIAKRNSSAVDGGGFDTRSKAQAQARAINANTEGKK